MIWVDKDWYSRYKNYLYTRYGMQKEKTMPKRINMNDMATTVAYKEQGRTEVNIAQIKQVLRIFLEELSTYEDEQILEVVKRYKED